MLGAVAQQETWMSPEAVRVESSELRELERAVHAVAVGQAQMLGKVDVLSTKLEARQESIERRVQGLEDAHALADTRQWVEKLLWAAVGALGGGGAVATFLQSFRVHP